MVRHTKKSCSKCCKIFKVCDHFTTLQSKGLKIVLLKRETFLVLEKAFSQLKMLTAPLIRSALASLSCQTLKVRRQSSRGLCKRNVLKNFAKFTENTCAGVSFLKKLQEKLSKYALKGSDFSLKFVTKLSSWINGGIRGVFLLFKEQFNRD